MERILNESIPKENLRPPERRDRINYNYYLRQIFEDNELDPLLITEIPQNARGDVGYSCKCGRSQHKSYQ